MKTFIHEEVYRGEALLKKIANASLTVCGCGAIGSNLVDNLARQGFQKLSVIDMDRIEDHNRNTQIWGKKEIGQLKVAMMKYRLFTDMGIQILDISKKLEESNVSKFLTKGTIVIDGFDNTESRKIVTDYCKKEHLDCLHVGLYQDYAEIMWNEDYKVPKKKGKDVCEYPLARNIVLMSVAVATEVLIRFVESKTKENYTITLKDFKVSRYEA